MYDLYGMRNIGTVEHIDGDGLFPPDASGMGDVRAKLNKK
jgi:hypothetical protein